MPHKMNMKVSYRKQIASAFVIGPVKMIITSSVITNHRTTLLALLGYEEIDTCCVSQGSVVTLIKRGE